AREHRYEDRPDRPDREDRDDAFDREREEDRNAVASLDSELAQACRDVGSLGSELAVGERADGAFLGFGDHRDAPRVVAERGRHVIHAAASPPRRPWHPATLVHCLAVPDAPLDRELALGRTPEALEVIGGPAQQRRVVAMTVALRKAAQATALEVPRAWLPRRTHHRHGTTARRSASDGVEEPIEVQPNDTRVAPYKRRGDEEEPVGEDQHHEEIPARREENSEEDEPQHRYPDRITRDHRAGPVAALAFETEPRSEEHTSELQSRGHLVCRLLLEKKNDEVTLLGYERESFRLHC